MSKVELKFMARPNPSKDSLPTSLTCKIIKSVPNFIKK